MGCFLSLCSGHYKKTRRPHRKAQGKKPKRKHRAQDKKKTIRQKKTRAKHPQHQIELPEAQWQETPKVETLPASNVAVANFWSSTSPPTKGKHSSYHTAMERAYFTSDDTDDRNPWEYAWDCEPRYHSARTSPPGSSPRESSSGSGQKHQPRSPPPTAPSTVPPVESHHIALPDKSTMGARGRDGAVYIHPHSMAHAHFLVLDYTKHRGSPVVYSALIPTGGQVSDLVATLAPENAGASLWARTDAGPQALQGQHPSPLASGSLYSLHGKICQLELWPARRPETPRPQLQETEAPKPQREKKTTTTMTTAAAKRVRELENQLATAELSKEVHRELAANERAKELREQELAAIERVRELEKALDEAKKKEREEAKTKKKKKGTHCSSRRVSIAFPAAAGSSEGGTSERSASGRRTGRPATTAGYYNWPSVHPRQEW